MIIHVRRRHIVAGKRRNTERCPIALAFYEISGLRPLVAYGAIVSSGGSFKLSARVREFMTRFDAGLPVKPFAFVLK